MLAPFAAWLGELGVTPFMLRLIVQLGLIVAVFFALQISAAVLVYMERKVAALVQQRYGPYLVGPHGLMQPLADIVKLMFKEELRPKTADTALFYVAPVLLGSTARPLLEWPLHSIRDQRRLVITDTRMVGGDIRLIARPK